MGTSIKGSCYENERVEEGKQEIIEFLTLDSRLGHLLLVGIFCAIKKFF